MTFSTFDTEFNDLYILCHNIIKNKRYIVTIYLLFKKWLSNCLRAHSKGPLIKQIIRILLVLNPSPQLFIIAFHVVVFLHHEKVIGLYLASYIRELFRMLANGTDRKLNSHVDISSRRITRNAKLCVDFLIQCFDGNINGLICSETM